MTFSCAGGAPGTVPGARTPGGLSEEFAMGIIGLIIAGLIIGLLGKFAAPGTRDNTPLWLTLLCGIGGGPLRAWGGGAPGGVPPTPGGWVRGGIPLIPAPGRAVGAAPP